MTTDTHWTVQHTKTGPLMHLQFVEIEGRLILHQLWWVWEWGNKQGFGRPMKRRAEWRVIPVGTLDTVVEGA